jgi:uncharacterized membrane-anchored protein
MTFTEKQVEWIVAEVLRRLGVAEATGGKSTISNGVELRIADKVVTMRTVEKRLADVKRVVVGRRTIVTPAVKDELKVRKIELVFEKG